MTDKEATQIIIDGVDVNGCMFFDTTSKSGPYCICDGNISDICEENPNCYYKQLARKTKECERQRKIIDYYIRKQEQLLDDLQAEKQKVEDLTKQRDAVLESYHQQAINIDNHFKMCERKRKYRLALEEIKQRSDELDELLKGSHYEWALNKGIQEILEKCEVLDPPD